ncbi:2-succinylbenzoate--CoA ligase [Shimwellia blattae]|nr:2-succinylbenzoate--CoA ligase [Shimwellia blattae]
MSFTDWPWREWRQQRGAAIALHLEGESLTWHQLCQQVDALAAGFFAQGVTCGAGVALRGKKQPADAALLAGAIAVRRPYSAAEPPAA